MDGLTCGCLAVLQVTERWRRLSCEPCSQLPSCRMQGELPCELHSLLGLTWFIVCVDLREEIKGKVGP